MMKLAIVFLPIVFAVIWMLFIGLRINKRDENRNDITEEKCGYLKIKESGELTQAGFDSLIYAHILYFIKSFFILALLFAAKGLRRCRRFAKSSILHRLKNSF